MAYLIKNIQYITDATGARNMPNGTTLRIEANKIVEIGTDLIAKPNETVIDAYGKVLMPGFVNTHHHLFQSVLKGLKCSINHRLFDWLNQVTFPRVSRVTESQLRAGVKLGLAELMLSGTTTCADHHYIYYQDSDKELGDIVFEEAEKLGIRMVLCRGGQLRTDEDMEYPNKNTPPESMDSYLKDIERLKRLYHQQGDNAMSKVVVAPNTPTFSLDPSMLRELASFSRSNGLRMHSHLSETENYVDFCLKTHQCLPVEFVAKNGWIGDDVWFAHMVHLTAEEISLLGETKTGISHCPSSNGRLASGIAPIYELDNAGATVSIGVDGAASNELANMLAELRLSWLTQRAVTKNAKDLTIERVTGWGTVNGAKLLGYDNLGLIQAGSLADFTLYDLDQLANFGMHEPNYSPIACGTATVDSLFCNGKPVVINKEIPNLDLGKLKADCQQAVTELA
jgi:8-oxoguanine deaminase